MRQRRRAERSLSIGRAGPQPGLTRRDTENRQRRLLVVGAGVAALAFVLILGFGWFFSSFQPPRRVVAVIGEETVQLRDLLPYVRLDAAATLTVQPQNALYNYIRDALFEQRGPSMGVTVSREEVDAAIAQMFELPASDPDAPLPEVLGEEGRERFDDFLEGLDVTEADYRSWAKGQLAQVALQNMFETLQQAEQEQVNLEWIVAENSALGQEAVERIQGGEGFADVAADLNIELSIADESGVVGWVPRGAFGELDDTIFAEDLEVGAAVGPLNTTLGSMVLRVTEGPSAQPLTDEMRSLIANAAFQLWLETLAAELVPELTMSTDDANWVVNHL